MQQGDRADGDFVGYLTVDPSDPVEWARLSSEDFWDMEAAGAAAKLDAGLYFNRVQIKGATGELAYASVPNGSPTANRFSLDPADGTFDDFPPQTGIATISLRTTTQARLHVVFRRK